MILNSTFSLFDTKRQNCRVKYACKQRILQQMFKRHASFDLPIRYWWDRIWIFLNLDRFSSWITMSCGYRQYLQWNLTHQYNFIWNVQTLWSNTFISFNKEVSRESPTVIQNQSNKEDLYIRSSNQK